MKDAPRGDPHPLAVFARTLDREVPGTNKYTAPIEAPECRIGTSCPRIEQLGWSYDIAGTDIPDDTLAAHERKARVPTTLLPELGALDIPDFAAWLKQHRKAPGDILRGQLR
jgi:hypothetical protein